MINFLHKSTPQPFLLFLNFEGSWTLSRPDYCTRTERGRGRDKRGNIERESNTQWDRHAVRTETDLNITRYENVHCNLYGFFNWLFVCGFLSKLWWIFMPLYLKYSFIYWIFLNNIIYILILKIVGSARLF